MIDSFRVLDNLLSEQRIGREYHHSLSVGGDSYYVKRGLKNRVCVDIMEKVNKPGKQGLKREQLSIILSIRPAKPTQKSGACRYYGKS